MSVTEAMIACRVDGVIMHVLHLDDGRVVRSPSIC